ncbi:MAG: nSTAND3 domain-containing NTPase [Solirubrobacteraceae bacterium]
MSQNGMVGYALERMGWFHFEQLCAALLELEGDVAPLAWAGSADRCRAVLSGTPLAPPLLTRRAPEPVLLLCSWVKARQPGGLLASVDRLLGERSEDVAVATSLVILTNVVCTAKLEARVRSALAGQRVTVRILGRVEIGRRLDARAELRRAMPSVLGLRDLDELIDPEVAARSSLDVAAARDLAAVFVPTRAYRHALGVLNAHGFAVLSGPPEMGKTAIARTIALAQLTDGWEAHECIRPEDIWRAFDPGRRQVFVADDAFGSTEYRADAGERWASEMERILRMLDDRHWLIWTSRPAPLKAGLGRIHRERGAERFPAPGEVLVDASGLDVAEKTLILFRHAKAAELNQDVRLWLERAGAEIVDEPHFTPERIRRFIARLNGLTEPEMKISGLMRRELADPTEAMATSFDTLEAEHKDLLIAMLDAPPGPVPERELVDALRRHHDGALRRPPVELVDRLSDHFLRTIA